MKKFFRFFTIFSSIFFAKLSADEPTCTEFSIPEGTRQFYETGIEKRRLEERWGRLEKVRVENLLQRLLPKAPATVLDVGGGTGVHSFFLAQKGYEVYLIDPVSFNIEEAKKIGENSPLKGYIIGDARKLPFEDNSVDIVLFFGPLYHLDQKDRKIALSEAYRVLKPGGKIFTQAVSKFAVLLNGFFDGKVKNDPAHLELISESLEKETFEYKKGIFFSHTPEELSDELKKAGYDQLKIYSVEGFGTWLNLEYWENNDLRDTLLHYLERTETEPSIIGLSSHFMAIGQKKSDS